MPLYVYVCKTCGVETEELQELDDPAPPTAESCPQGGQGCDLQKRICGATLKFQPGTTGEWGGWQETDKGVHVRTVKGT